MEFGFKISAENVDEAKFRLLVEISSMLYAQNQVLIETLAILKNTTPNYVSKKFNQDVVMGREMVLSRIYESFGALDIDDNNNEAP